MKVIVSGMAWISLDEAPQKVIDHLREKLVIVPRTFKGYDDDDASGVPTEIRCYAMDHDRRLFGVPRDYWFDTAKSDHDYVVDVSMGSPIQTRCLIRHDGRYAEQAEIVRGLYDHLTMDRRGVSGFGGGILRADTGAGKTNVALSLIHRIGRTALVIVHKDFLLTQWVRRIEQWMPGTKVGIVRGKKCDIDGKDIVVAMIQSMVEHAADYPKALYRWPAVVVWDEVHRMGAPTFSTVIHRFESAYRLGLSATPRRKDGADHVFWWHIGPIAYHAKTETPKPMVRLIRVADKVPDAARNHDTKYPVVVNILTRLPRRNAAIVAEVVKAVNSPSKRKVLVLSERLMHLRSLSELLQKALSTASIDFYVDKWFSGERRRVLRPGTWDLNDPELRKEAILALYRKIGSGGSGRITSKRHWVIDPRDPMGDNWIVLEEVDNDDIYQLAKDNDVHQSATDLMVSRSDLELQEAQRAQVIFGTYQMLSEGVDMPSVDTIILATPISDAEQAVGRVRRFCDPSDGRCEVMCPWRAGECQGKPTIVVSDIVDEGVPMSDGRESWRRRFYSSIGCKVSGS